MFIKRHKIAFLVVIAVVAAVAITTTGNTIATEPVLPW